jgi:hypothetical protein
MYTPEYSSRRYPTCLYYMGTHFVVDEGKTGMCCRNWARS